MVDIENHLIICHTKILFLKALIIYHTKILFLKAQLLKIPMKYNAFFSLINNIIPKLWKFRIHKFKNPWICTECWDPRISSSFTVYIVSCLNRTSLWTSFVFVIDRLNQQKLSTLGLYIKCGLYRIPVYSGFCLVRFHCTMTYLWLHFLLVDKFFVWY